MFGEQSPAWVPALLVKHQRRQLEMEEVGEKEEKEGIQTKVKLYGRHVHA